MKKYFLMGLLAPIAVLCILGFTARKDYSLNSLKSTIICKTLSAAASNYELLENVTGRTYVIDNIMFSASSANSLYLNDSATNADVEYGYYRVIANSMVIDDVCLKLTKAAGLYITTSGAGEICIEYHLE